MNRTLAVLAIVAAPLCARAQPAAPGDLGTPLPTPSAMPALTGLTPYVMSFDITDIPTLPALTIAPGVMTPRLPQLFGGVNFRSYAGGFERHRFWYYSIGGGAEFGLGGGNSAFDAGGKMYTNGSARFYSMELPSPGYGYRTQKWLIGAQLIPAVQWITADYKVGLQSFGGSDHYYTVSADLQVCRQYNMAGALGKNSAACLYVAPVIYRDGWFQGASFGLRWIPL